MVFGRRKKTIDVGPIHLPRPDLPTMPHPHVSMPDLHLPSVRLPERGDLPRLRLPEISVPRPHMPDVSVPRPHLPDIDIPRPRLPEVRLPTVRTPEVRLPHVRTPEVQIPAARLPDVPWPDVRLPAYEGLSMPDLAALRAAMPSRADVRLPSIHLPEVDFTRIPGTSIRPSDYELIGRPPFVRRRTHPVLRAVKFVLGIGVGLAFGVIVAALLAPAPGDETRRRLRDMLPGTSNEADGAESVTAALPATGVAPARGPSEPEPSDLLGRLKWRVKLASEEAARERDIRRQQLIDRFHTAQRTGSVPETGV